MLYIHRIYKARKPSMLRPGRLRPVTPCDCTGQLSLAAVWPLALCRFHTVIPSTTNIADL